MRPDLGVELTPFRIAAIYAAIGLAALLFSDVLLVALVDDPVLLRDLQAAKGAIEVLLTASLVYGLVTVYRRANEQKTRDIERARDRFAFLNSLLRHHVLNRMNVVQGQVRSLLETESSDADRLSTIQRQCQSVVDLVENVRALSRPPGRGYDDHPVDLFEVLTDEVAQAMERHPRAEIETAVPRGVHVGADESLAMVFENLLSNAIVHNDADVPVVRVTVEVDDDRVVARVTDNGPGIPADALARFAEADRRGHEELGLHLVRTLVDRYDGEVWLEEGDGGTVAIELPRVEAPERRGGDPVPPGP